METLTLTKEEIVLLPKSDIELNPNNARGIDEQSSITIDELKQSIESNGLINALRVRLIKPPVSKGMKYQVIAGNRRLRALRLINVELIPCIIQDMDDRKIIDIQMSENLQREDLSPLEEAELYASYIAANPKEGRQGLAAKVGKNIIYVNNRIRLRDLSDKAKAHLRMKEIATNAALKLTMLTHKQQDEALRISMRHIDTDTGKRWVLESVADLTNAIFRHNFQELENAPFDMKAEGMNDTAPTCVVCPKRTGNNPGLFDDVVKGDRCGDATCFQKKCVTFYKNLSEELTKKHKKEVGFLLMSSNDNAGWGKLLRPLFMPSESHILSTAEEKDTKMMETARLVVLVGHWESWKGKEEKRLFAYYVKPQEYNKKARPKSKASPQQTKHRNEQKVWKMVENNVDTRIVTATVPRLAETSVRKVIAAMIEESSHGGHSRQLIQLLHANKIFGYSLMDIGVGIKSKNVKVTNEGTELPKNFIFEEDLGRVLVDVDVAILINILIKMYAMTNWNEDRGGTGHKQIQALFGLNIDKLEKEAVKYMQDKAKPKPVVKKVPVKAPAKKVALLLPPPVKKVAPAKAAKKKTGK